MWSAFAIVICCVILLLYFPGMMLLNSCNASFLFSFVIAPPVTLALYGIFEIVYAKIHVFSSWSTVFLPIVVFGIITAVTSILFRSHYGACRKRWGFLSDSYKNLGLSALYCVIGLMTTLVIFVRKLDGIDSISQLFDNAWHLGIIRKFIETGNYSTLSSGDIVPTIGSTFYPTGWHSLVALLMSMTGIDIGFAENAVNVTIIAIVFPLSMFAFMASVLHGRYNVLLVSSATPLMFAAYPWRFLTFGPLYSNLLSFAILPGAMALLFHLLYARTVSIDRLRYACLFVVALCGIVVTQPNAVFTLGVLMVPYLFYQIPKYFQNVNIPAPNRRILILLTSISVAILIVLAWMWLYSLPELHRTVSWKWPAFVTKVQALIDVAFVGFHNAEPQMLLGFLVAIGILYTLAHSAYLWVTISYAVICSLYCLSASTDGIAKQILTGFWYHDAYRLGASAVIIGILLSGMGLYSILRIGELSLEYISRGRVKKIQQISIDVICILVAMIVIYYPNYYLAGQRDETTAFGAIRRDITFWNSSNEPKSYNRQERLFVERVKHIVPKGEVVLNQPYDGSAYAYGIDGLNVYYKAWEGNWMGRPTKENYLISSRLYHMSSDPSVCSVVRSSGARYLLLLDRTDYAIDTNNPKKNASMYAQYVRSDWKGIDKIGDSTPGFSVILRDGDMRLYQINSTCTQ